MMSIQPREHTLSALLKGICSIPSVLDCRIYGVSLDSRKVKKGDLFIALNGIGSAARAYVPQAVENGAVAILVESDDAVSRICEEGDAVEIFVPGLKSQVGKIADHFFGNPSKHMKVVGVTGTNGKTSVSQYLASVLTGLGEKTGVIGTLGYGLPPRLEAATHTTPDVVKVHQVLSSLVAQGAKAAAVEVSSHGLDQGRVDAVNFTGAVFTNISRDHLDYHESMDAYKEAKKALFVKPGLSFAVINLDDDYGQGLIDSLEDGVHVVSYGISHTADITIDRVQYSKKGIEAELSSQWGSACIRCELLGAFNLSNVLAVIGVALALGYDLDEVSQQVAELKPVTGRMQVYSAPDLPSVVIDYAHTPDALKNALEAVKQHCKGKVWCVFGCGGDRDRGKRPLMAQAAEKYADEIVVTDDNPRTESASDIITEILQGFSGSSVVEVVHDRRAAIEVTVGRASKKDMILVAGKGHEDYQEIDGIRLAYSDIDVVEALFEVEGA